MEHITEDYCDKELTGLLISNGYIGHRNIYLDKDGFKSERISLQSAMKWLREEKHYYIQIMLDGWSLGEHRGYYVVIQRTDNDFEMMLQDVCDEVFYKTPEEACEVAIKYCLENLI